ncbi:MAG: hypothetical protein ACD_2C00259G0001, partial [uncultured bacterium (gcode 4)]
IQGSSGRYVLHLQHQFHPIQVPGHGLPRESQLPRIPSQPLLMIRIGFRPGLFQQVPLCQMRRPLSDHAEIMNLNWLRLLRLNDLHSHTGCGIPADSIMIRHHRPYRQHMNGRRSHERSHCDLSHSGLTHMIYEHLNHCVNMKHQ